MITVIDNNQRVFLVNRKGFATRNYFCNLEGIPSVLKDLEVNDEFTISENWNGKFKQVSKKRLNEMFEANGINFKL